MIQLTNKVNKTKLLKELKKKAEDYYNKSWQPELQVDAFTTGCKELLSILQENKAK